MRWAILLVLVVICCHFVVADTETPDDCSVVDRTIYVSVLGSNNQYSFGVSENYLTENTCVQFRLTNYDFEGDNYTLHHLDIDPSESIGVSLTHRSFPIDGSYKLVNVFVPSGLRSLSIYCGDDDHRQMGLLYTFMVGPPVSNVYVSPTTTYQTPTVTQTRVRVPGFEFPFACLVLLGLSRKIHSRL